jgi:hypothetical protein
VGGGAGRHQLFRGGGERLEPRATTTSATAQFAIPNWSGEVAQITGRAANVNNVECDPGISTVTRWQIGGLGDAGIPPQPLFGLGGTGRRAGPWR